jgi:hypothetical protein
MGTIASGLGALFQGLLQGKMMRQQSQVQQQQLTDDRLNNSLNVYKLLSQVGQSDPQALNSPQFQSFIKQQSAQGGVPVPTDAAGNVDARAFRQPLSGLTSNAGLYSQFNQYEPGSVQRQQILANYGGDDTQKQALLNAEQVRTGPEIDNANSQMSRIATLVVNNAIDMNDPRNQGLVSAYNSYADIAKQPHWQGAPVSQKVQATIDKTKAQTKGIEQTNYYRPMLNNARIQNWNALTNKTNVEAWAIPQRVVIASRNASTAAQRADDNHAKLQMDIKAFSQLGTTPQALSAYDGLTARVQNQVNLDKTALVGVRQSMDAILKSTNGANPPANSFAGQQLQFLSGEQQKIQARYDASVKALQQFTAGKGKFNQSVLHGQGAPSSWQLPSEVNSPAFQSPIYQATTKNANGDVIPVPQNVGGAAQPAQAASSTLQKQIDYLKGMPKNKAAALIKGASNYSDAEKQQMLSAIGASP